MSAPGIYYHVGKYLVWIWHNHTQKKQIKYEDIIFQYPIKTVLDSWHYCRNIIYHNWIYII